MKIIENLKNEIFLLNKKINDVKDLIFFINKKNKDERYPERIKNLKTELENYNNEINIVNEWMLFLEKKRIKLYSLYYKGVVRKYKLKPEFVNNVCILDELNKIDSKDIINLLRDKTLKLSVDLFIKIQTNYDIDNITDNIIDFILKYHVIGTYIDDMQIYNLNTTKIITKNKDETGFYMIIYYII